MSGAPADHLTVIITDGVLECTLAVYNEAVSLPMTTEANLVWDIYGVVMLWGRGVIIDFRIPQE